MSKPEDTRPPGEPPINPHADRPNWRPAETFDEYVTNCAEGLELFSERRASKLLGISRITLWRWRQAAELPEDLIARLSELRPRPSNKQLAQIAVALREGELDTSEVERCPHCGGVVRRRYWISEAALKVIRKWAREQEQHDATGGA